MKSNITLKYSLISMLIIHIIPFLFLVYFYFCLDWGGINIGGKLEYNYITIIYFASGIIMALIIDKKIKNLIIIHSFSPYLTSMLTLFAIQSIQSIITGNFSLLSFALINSLILGYFMGREIKNKTVSQHHE